MAEPVTPTPEPTEPAAAAGDEELGDAGKKAIAEERKARREAEKRAKDSETELDKLRQQSMTDQEKAVAQARNEGKAEALTLLGAAKVEAAFAVASSGRIEPASLKVLIQGLNHSAFINDDGTVDDESVSNFIDGIAPKPDPNRRVDLGQGARMGGKNGPGAQNADPLVAALTRMTQ